MDYDFNIEQAAALKLWEVKIEMRTHEIEGGVVFYVIDVECRNERWKSRRRYSQFDWYLEMLRASLTGLPELPDKGSSVSLNHDKRQARMMALGSWLHSLTNRADVMSMELTMEFLSWPYELLGRPISLSVNKLLRIVDPRFAVSEASVDRSCNLLFVTLEESSYLANVGKIMNLVDPEATGGLAVYVLNPSLDLDTSWVYKKVHDVPFASRVRGHQLFAATSCFVVGTQRGTVHFFKYSVITAEDEEMVHLEAQQNFKESHNAMIISLDGVEGGEKSNYDLSLSSNLLNDASMTNCETRRTISCPDLMLSADVNGAIRLWSSTSDPLRNEGELSWKVHSGCRLSKRLQDGERLTSSQLLIQGKTTFNGLVKGDPFWATAYVGTTRGRLVVVRMGSLEFNEPCQLVGIAQVACSETPVTALRLHKSTRTLLVAVGSRVVAFSLGDWSLMLKALIPKTAVGASPDFLTDVITEVPLLQPHHLFLNRVWTLDFGLRGIHSKEANRRATRIDVNGDDLSRLLLGHTGGSISVWQATAPLPVVVPSSFADRLASWLEIPNFADHATYDTSDLFSSSLNNERKQTCSRHSYELIMCERSHVDDPFGRATVMSAKWLPMTGYDHCLLLSAGSDGVIKLGRVVWPEWDAAAVMNKSLSLGEDECGISKMVTESDEHSEPLYECFDSPVFGIPPII